MISRSLVNDIDSTQITQVSLQGTVIDENSHGVTHWWGTITAQHVVGCIISRLFCTRYRTFRVFSCGGLCQLMKNHLCWSACTTDMEIHVPGSDEDVDAFCRNEVSLQSEHLGHIRASESRTSGSITVIYLIHFIGTDRGNGWHNRKLEMNTCCRNWAAMVYNRIHKTLYSLITKCFGEEHMPLYVWLSLLVVFGAMGITVVS